MEWFFCDDVTEVYIDCMLFICIILQNTAGDVWPESEDVALGEYLGLRGTK
jgi:hypothetical protein